MKYITYMILSLLFSGAALSAEIKTNRDVRFLVLNENEVDSAVGPVELYDGYNQLVLRATKTLGKGSSKTVFDSAPFILTFESTGSDIEVVLPKMFNSEQAKRHFEGVPDITLLSNGAEVEYTYQKLEGKKGFMPYMNVPALVVSQNEKNNIYFGKEAEIVTKAQRATTNTDSKVEMSKNDAIDSDNLDQLKAWFLKADKAERKAFRKWMIDQE